MTKHDIEAAIQARLEDRKASVLNKNAISALFGAFSDPMSALGKVFLGREEALEQEKQRIQQDIMLELLCEIDRALSQANNKAMHQGIVVDGLIETTAENGDSVVGLNIGVDSGAVTIQPGTHVKTRAIGVRHAVGVKIGS